MAMVTGLTADTHKHLELNAGVFLEDFDHSAATDAATFKAILEAAIEAKTGLLGATRGGGTFVATPEVREPDIDGKRYRILGNIFVDSWDVRLTGTLVEAYAGNFKRTLMSADIATTGKKEVLTLRTQVSDADYIPKLSWVSTLGDGTYIVIDLENVINIDGLTFTFADKNEGTIPFSFAATVSDLTKQDKAPFSITYYKPAA